MLLEFVLLLLLLSLESVIALPLFFLFFVLRRALKFSLWPRFLYLLLITLLLAHFYTLPLTLTLVLFLLLSAALLWLKDKQPRWYLFAASLTLVLLGGYVFFSANLVFNYFYPVQLLLLLIYLFKKYWRSYRRG